MPPPQPAQVDSYPAPFVGGWYAFAHDEELRPGAVMGFEIDGEKLVAFRSATQPHEVSVLDRHCPHLGADLSQGQVTDGCLECPFHKWRFGCDGQVNSIPYSKAPLRLGLRARRWWSTNFHGVLCVYIDANRDRRRAPPPYPLRRFANIDDGRAVLRGRRDGGLCRLHIAELAENSADVPHFQYLHGHMNLPFTRLRIPDRKSVV